MQKTSYIWFAEQTEPGMNGRIYAATNTNAAPESTEASRVPGTDNLVYAESLYSEWRLLGTAKGGCYSNEYGDFVELDTPVMQGAPVELEEVVRCGWYSPA